MKHHEISNILKSKSRSQVERKLKSTLPCKSSVVGQPPPSSSLGVGCVIAR